MTRSACTPAYHLHKVGPRYHAPQRARQCQRYRWCVRWDQGQIPAADHMKRWPTET